MQQPITIEKLYDSQKLKKFLIFVGTVVLISIPAFFYAYVNGDLGKEPITLLFGMGLLLFQAYTGGITLLLGIYEGLPTWSHPFIPKILSKDLKKVFQAATSGPTTRKQIGTEIIGIVIVSVSSGTGAALRGIDGFIWGTLMGIVLAMGMFQYLKK